MRHEKTVSVSKIRHLWEPWEEDETPRKVILVVEFLLVSINKTVPHSMCYSHYGNGVRNGAISIDTVKKMVMV